ncbi:MAG: hypothetical protein LBB78_03385 [Spirochaetaceae bacterium]|jgi:hypothetical protein|nr:hypothetical protein [Spirochaetaceae bacterium]
MKKKGEFALAGVLLFLSALAFTGCGMSKKDLTEQVKASIEEQWEDQGLDIEIEDLTLIKKSDEEYRGILEVKSDDESISLTVLVTVDGDSFMWEIED